MKSSFLSILFLWISMSGAAQSYYRCSTDSIPVLVEPYVAADTFFIATPYYGCQVGNVFISKGFVCSSKNVITNGYIKIYNPYNTICWDEGWIPTACLKPATKCNICSGKGITTQTCTVCHGIGDWNCCHYKGKTICDFCNGIGYR